MTSRHCATECAQASIVFQLTEVWNLLGSCIWHEALGLCLW